jgi:hypothetical protein
MAPAAINKDIPPSIGMHGGGQQVGPPPGGGGGGGNAMHNDPNPNKKITKYIYLMFIIEKLMSVKV